MSLNDDTTDLDTNEAGDDGGEHNADDNDAGAAAVAASLAGGGGDGEFVIEGEKKPTSQSTLLLFGLILVGAGVVYFMYLRGGPDAATAAANAEAEQAKQTISQFLDGGEKNMIAMQQMLKDTEKVVGQFRQYPSMKQVPLESLQNNPFQFKAPKETDPNAAAVAARKKQEEERKAILKKVEELSLQTVIASGTRKACMINGTLFQEGQVVEGFTIDKIEAGGVIVKNGAYRFVLKMKK
jgi:hypothetical protein